MQERYVWSWQYWLSRLNQNGPWWRRCLQVQRSIYGHFAIFKCAASAPRDGELSFCARPVIRSKSRFTQAKASASSISRLVSPWPTILVKPKRRRAATRAWPALSCSVSVLARIVKGRGQTVWDSPGDSGGLRRRGHFVCSADLFCRENTKLGGREVGGVLIIARR